MNFLKEVLVEFKKEPLTLYSKISISSWYNQKKKKDTVQINLQKAEQEFLEIQTQLHQAPLTWKT